MDLTRVPGLGSYAVLQLVGETGCDMSPWKSDKHFTSWLALAPNNKESAGRIFRRATQMSSSRAAKLFRLAACAVRNTQTALGAFYRRIRSRRGAPKAITATARKIATIYFRMLATGEEFIELGQDAYERQYQQRLLSNLRRKGYPTRLQPRSRSIHIMKNAFGRECQSKVPPRVICYPMMLRLSRYAPTQDTCPSGWLG